MFKNKVDLSDEDIRIIRASKAIHLGMKQFAYEQAKFQAKRERQRKSRNLIGIILGIILTILMLNGSIPPALILPIFMLSVIISILGIIYRLFV
jgi:hypothetical protein